MASSDFCYLFIINHILLITLLIVQQICDKLAKKGWNEKYNNVAEQAIAYGEEQLTTYDNVRSIKAKVDYINEMELGGAMVWALDFDDFTGKFCGDGKYPLLKAINEVRYHENVCFCCDT